MKNLRDLKNNKPIFRRRSFWEQRKVTIALVGAGLIALVAGAISEPKLLGFLGNWKKLGQPLAALNQKESNTPQASVIPLLSLPVAERNPKLEAIAQGSNSLDRNRARFLLADDAIQQKQGKKALEWLEGLESDYPVMAAYAVYKRAQAHEVAGDDTKAKDAWKELLNRYPKEPVAAEGLYALSQSDPKYGDRAIAEFPTHPRTLEIASRRLERDPNQPKLLLILTKYSFDTPVNSLVLDRLGQLFATTLKPQDWEAIAYRYWENKEYNKASTAYSKAPRTPRNAYRVARGLQLAGKKPEAKAAYEQVVNEFPSAKETGTSLLRIADLSRLEDEVPYLDRAIAKFPDSAGEALVLEAQVLDKLKSTKAAEETRQTLVTKFGTSEAAAEYRWKMAQKRAATGDFQGAGKWAQPITTQSPDSKFAPRANFWVGKWAKRLGRQQEAKAAFENTVAKYPQSYYAWRSAAILGLPVGDFNTVRKLTPQVALPAVRSPLPVGSETLKELYQLNLDKDAWTLWQAEFQNQIQPTIAEQYTDGLMHLAKGEYLEAISLVSTLEDRETPEDRAEYQKIKQQPAYWQTLYPFPFPDIVEKWSQQRQINPLLVISLIRQESRFMPTIHSAAGAVGLMQVLPSTASGIAQKSNLKEYKLENPNDNIRIGTSFLDDTHQIYKNNSMLAVASYNAGPGNVSKWLQGKGAVDPDEFVETIPFEETKGYVKNVFGNYWNYSRLYDPQVSQAITKYSADKAASVK